MRSLPMITPGCHFTFWHRWSVRSVFLVSRPVQREAQLLSARQSMADLIVFYQDRFLEDSNRFDSRKFDHHIKKDERLGIKLEGPVLPLNPFTQEQLKQYINNNQQAELAVYSAINDFLFKEKSLHPAIFEKIKNKNRALSEKLSNRRILGDIFVSYISRLVADQLSKDVANPSYENTKRLLKNLTEGGFRYFNDTHKLKFERKPKDESLGLTLGSR